MDSAIATGSLFSNEINRLDPDHACASNLARELNRVILPAQKKNNPEVGKKPKRAGHAPRQLSSHPPIALPSGPLFSEVVFVPRYFSIMRSCA
ncbi:MAG: hypothetical protein O7G84_06825, partial [Gammaproteobacteria bacterium]|nr:hypothetical protein [Gammaproteobacteria bacterium]